MNEKKCCGTCGNGKINWVEYSLLHNKKTKRILCKILLSKIPKPKLPPLPIWAWYDLNTSRNDNLFLKSDGQGCPCWKNKK